MAEAARGFADESVSTPLVLVEAGPGAMWWSQVRPRLVRSLLSDSGVDTVVGCATGGDAGELVS
jgi:hypothetical protein